MTHHSWMETAIIIALGNPFVPRRVIRQSWSATTLNFIIVGDDIKLAINAFPPLCITCQSWSATVLNISEDVAKQLTSLHATLQDRTSRQFLQRMTQVAYGDSLSSKVRGTCTSFICTIFHGPLVPMLNIHRPSGTMLNINRLRARR